MHLVMLWMFASECACVCISIWPNVLQESVHVTGLKFSTYVTCYDLGKIQNFEFKSLRITFKGLEKPIFVRLQAYFGHTVDPRKKEPSPL